MSKKFHHPHYIEGEYRFDFEPSCHVCRLECSEFYSHRVQNFCNSCKEIDFVVYDEQSEELWLIEVKDYRFNARPRVSELCEKLCRKVRDTLFLLRTAACCAPMEEVDEGICLQEMGERSLAATRIRLGFLIELSGEQAAAMGTLMTIHDILLRQLRFIDPDLVCLPISRSGGKGPWAVSHAKGELSTRVKKRQLMLQAQELQESRRSFGYGQQSPHSRRSGRHKKQSKIPHWKRRAMERERGYSGTRADRPRHFDDL